MWRHEHDEEDYYYSSRYPPPPPSPPRRFPSPRHMPNPHRRSSHLSPDPPFGSSLHRSRSYGHSPRPEINIYNYQDQVADQTQRPPPVPIPVFPPSPDPRGRQDARLADELLAAEIAEMRLDRLARSRSRGKSDAPVYEHPAGPNFYKWQMEQLEKEKHDAEQRKYWEAKRRIEAEEKEKHDAEQRKYWEAKRKVEADEADAERRRIIEEHDKELKERAARVKEEERRVLEKLERDKKEAKEEEKRILERHAREEQEAREREEQQWKEFERKKKEKEEEEERKAKAEKEKIEAEMLSRLLKAGYSLEQAEAMLDPKEAKKLRKKKEKEDPIDVIIEGGNEIVVAEQHTHHAPLHVPVYAKIHKKYLDVQTLRYYQIPYEYDRANADYIIILQEMDKAETDLLFEHTRRLRKGRLLLEPEKEKKKEFAWVRKRDRSKSVGRKDIRVVELRR